MSSLKDLLPAKPRCFAYWATNGVATLGDNLDNDKYPQVVLVNMEEFLRDHKREQIAIAEQLLVL